MSALTRATLAEMCTFRPTRDIAAAIMHETIEIARAFGTEPGIEIDRDSSGRGYALFAVRSAARGCRRDILR